MLKTPMPEWNYLKMTLRGESFIVNYPNFSPNIVSKFHISGNLRWPYFSYFSELGGPNDFAQNLWIFNNPLQGLKLHRWDFTDYKG